MDALFEPRRDPRPAGPAHPRYLGHHGRIIHPRKSQQPHPFLSELSYLARRAVPIPGRAGSGDANRASDVAAGIANMTIGSPGTSTSYSKISKSAAATGQTRPSASSSSSSSRREAPGSYSGTTEDAKTGYQTRWQVDNSRSYTDPSGNRRTLRSTRVRASASNAAGHNRNPSSSSGMYCQDLTPYRCN